MEPFQKLGADLAKNDWILHLDDDEIPDRELLITLRCDKNVAGYLLQKYEILHKNRRWSMRYYNRKYVQFTGVIHWGMIPKGKIERLESGTLYHYEKPTTAKMKKYAYIDANVYGYKILYVLKERKWHPQFNRSKMAEFFSKLSKLQFLLGRKIGWVLSFMEYLILQTLYNVVYISRTVKTKFLRFFYGLCILGYVITDFNRKINMWESLFKEGSLNAYLGLNHLEDFEKLRGKGK